MKTRLLSLFLAVVLSAPAMTGCQATRKVESAGNAVAYSVEPIGDNLKQAIETTGAMESGKPVNPALTLAQAQNIALKHAGFTADQVTALRTEYEIEHGVPQYDVEFRHGFWEYNYEIHGDTGEILSYSKDD